MRATLDGAGVKEGGRLKEDQIYKTKVVFATVMPVWNHNMFFRVSPTTKKQLKAAAGTDVGVLGTLYNGAVNGAGAAAGAFTRPLSS
jgi:hypothetical protein